jgi:hypothetical protein
MASADDIVIDKAAFHDRLSNFIAQWKNDKRAGETLFGGVGSIVICIGKASEQTTSYTKSAAFQVISPNCGSNSTNLLSSGSLGMNFQPPSLSLPRMESPFRLQRRRVGALYT